MTFASPVSHSGRSPMVAVLILLVAGFPLQAQTKITVPDPDPELERKSFVVADGFEVNLFAADPLLAKPIQMNFDPAGRLWVACSEAYPQVKPGQKQNDKVIILEDTKGVGKADKTTVFAEGLLIPTGLAPGDGGVYVVDSTDLLHLSASKGTGQADRRRVVLSGFGTEDTHHMVHTLRWGPDGMLYFNQSVYIHSHIETPLGPRRLNGGGIWQYRPETQQLEVFARGWVNAWGHDFDRWGQSFVTDGAYGEGINYVIPGAYYFWAVGAERIVAGLNPGSPKHCGLEIVSGRHLPDSWQGNMITNDFRGHRVCRFVVTPEGSGYTSREQTEVIKTTHPAFRPIDVKMGPDGAIYIADWYNPIIQHGEVDFRDPRRDHTHGRIWRVTAKNRPLVPRPQLVGAKTEDLLEALKTPEDWTRQQARRVLKERGREIVPVLAAWVAIQDAGNPAQAANLLEGLWTFQALDVVEPKLLGTLLRTSNAHIRAAATRVLSAWHDRLRDPLELLATQVNDDHPQVRLEAVRALAQVREARSVELALVALDQPVDRFLDYALWLTCRDLMPSWMPALEQGRVTFGGNTRRLLFALKAVGSHDVLRPLVNLVRANKVPVEGEEDVLTMIASLGTPRDLSLLLERVTAHDTSERLRVSLLRALEHAGRQRKVRPEGDLARILPFLKTGAEPLRAVTARLAGLWGQESVRPTLVELALSPKTNDLVRQAALDGLVNLSGSESKQTIETLCRDEKASANARRLALIALTGMDVNTAAKRAAPVLDLSADGTGAAEVFEAFIQRKKGADLLAKALAEQKLPGDVARVGVRVVRSSGRDAPALVAALTKAGSLTFGPRKLPPKELAQMVADVMRQGDPARGERIYRRKDMLCLKCHAIGGAGGQVGPDMTSIGASAQIDYLIESIVEPNKAVKEGFHSTLITTTKGNQLSGIKVRETTNELVLRTAEDKEITLSPKDIEERSMGGSLMPDGLTDTLTRPEFVDLVRFLSELGKVGSYSVSKARLVRRWQTLEDTPEIRKLLATGPEAVLKDDPKLFWSSAYSDVAGTLPLTDLPRLEVGPDKVSMAFVRFQLEVTTTGPALLKFNETRGVAFWLNRTAVPLREATELNLPLGVQTVTLGIDLPQRKEALLCEMEDKPGSPARVRVVGGK
jgi:putative heme-binding domain-containing protein